MSQMTSMDVIKDELTKKAATVQVTVSLLASLSVTSSGIGFGYPAITSQLLSEPDDIDNIVLTQSEISWFASITAICCPIGSLASGYLSEKIGRRKTLMLVNIIAITSWLIIGFSSRQDAFIFFIELMIGRALIGITIGMITTPTVMYCSEVCHPKIRGRMTVLSTPFFISFGSLIAYLLGYCIPKDFRLVSLIAAGMTVATFIVLFFIPESPVYLVTKNQKEKARSALAKLRDLSASDSRIDTEIQRIEELKRSATKHNSIFSNFKEFGKPELYQPFFIMTAFFAVQQFCGIFVILVYAAQFSIEAGVAIDAFLSA
ncbi:Sugar transporter ERD6-like 6, partial [Pseudolycoriella hygida]